MPILRIVQEAPCFPVTLAEARRHLAVDASDRSVDSLIEMLIASATSDAENKTGRIWVESVWNWVPDKLTVGELIPFPVTPVTQVVIHDLDEEVPENGAFTDISGALVSCVFPSPEPQGSPLIGSLLPISEFPAHYEMLLTIGYPVQETVTPVEQFDVPTLVPVKTGYAGNKIRLVFSRPVTGVASPDNFTITVDGGIKAATSVEFSKGSVDLVFDTGVILEQDEPLLSYIGGSIYDQFGNFVEPITDQVIPTVVFTTEAEFQEPTAVPVETIYTAQTPSPVKNWILTRVGSLYSQRTEIALRAGKSNDALFPDGFINNLLNPYKVRFA